MNAKGMVLLNIFISLTLRGSFRGSKIYTDMKKVILFIGILLFSAPYIQAQEVKMASIPYPMHFENKVLNYKDFWTGE